MGKIKNVHELSDEDLESCVDGTTDLRMIRNILTRDNVVDELGWIDPEVFAEWFARAIEGFIDAEADSVEWHEVNDNNWTWGYDIGDNINSFISDNFKEQEDAT